MGCRPLLALDLHASDLLFSRFQAVANHKFILIIGLALTFLLSTIVFSAPDSEDMDLCF